MLNKIPKELILKLKTDLKISKMTSREIYIKFTQDEIDLFNICEKWYEKLFDMTGFCKIDVGPYKGLFPLSLDRDTLKVYFNIDMKSPDNWKDWFIEEKDEYLVHHWRELLEKK